MTNDSLKKVWRCQALKKLSGTLDVDESVSKLSKTMGMI